MSIVVTRDRSVFPIVSCHGKTNVFCQYSFCFFCFSLSLVTYCIHRHTHTHTHFYIVVVVVLPAAAFGDCPVFMSSREQIRLAKVSLSTQDTFEGGAGTGTPLGSRLGLYSLLSLFFHAFSRRHLRGKPETSQANPAKLTTPDAKR